MIRWADLRRLARILTIMARHLLAHEAGRRWPRLAARLGVAPLPGPQRLRQACEDLGGTFLKFGQMLALQPDILSLEYCNALFDLLDRVPPFGWDEVERVFRAELGRTPDEVFERFERAPLATASIGQVHVAWLAGRKVAVKVQRPVAEVEFAGDLRLMSAGMALIRRLRLAPLSWLLEPMGEFVAWTREELDYRHEARYMERLRENARDNPRERVPEVASACTTRRLLAAEFLEGVTVLAYLRALEAGDEVMIQRLRAGGLDPGELARNMIDNFLGDAFRHGVFHADLHPANLMILPGNVVGYIDFGITGVLSRYSRYHLVMLTLAYTRGDLEGMCASFLKVSTMAPGADPAAFLEGLRRLADSWYERQGSRTRLRKNFTLVMLDMLRLSKATGIWPERDVVKYIRSAIAIDGLITRFAPGFDLGDHLAASCDRLFLGARRELFSLPQVLGWASAGGRLADGAPRRAAALLARMADGELPVRARLVAPPGRALRDRRLVALGALVFTLSSLTALSSPAGAVLGLNLFTAELVVLSAALARLVRAAIGTA